jgi:RimJ/RimL family protein N-acetyltransferase
MSELVFDRLVKGALVRELETERLLLRYFRMEDVEPIHRLIYSDPEVYPWWGGVPLPVPEVEDRVVLWMHSAQASSFGNLAVVRKQDNRLMGFVALQNYVASWIRLAEDPTSPYNLLEVEVSYVLGREYWGHGYAAEVARALVDYAFRTLCLRQLVNTIEAENIHSIALAKRLGFREERNYHTEATESIWVLDNDLGAGTPAGSEPHCC